MGERTLPRYEIRVHPENEMQVIIWDTVVDARHGDMTLSRLVDAPHGEQSERYKAALACMKQIVDKLNNGGAS